MQQCTVIESANSEAYNMIGVAISGLASMRETHYLVRHNLYTDFVREDDAGISGDGKDAAGKR